MSGKHVDLDQMSHSASSDLGLCMSVPILKGKYGIMLNLYHSRANLADDKLMFFLFSQKIGINISCKRFPKKTIFLNVKAYFLEKKKK